MGVKATYATRNTLATRLWRLHFNGENNGQNRQHITVSRSSTSVGRSFGTPHCCGQRAAGASDAVVNLLLSTVCGDATIPVSFGQRTKTVQRHSAEPSLALGLSDNGQIGFRIDAQGYGEFIPFAENQPMSRIQLVPALSLLAQSQGERQIYALSQPDGRLLFVQPALSRTENRSPAWMYPLGEQAYSLGCPRSHCVIWR